MVHIDLNDDEAKALLKSLEWLLSETRMEIADTEQAEFRAGLKLEKHALEDVIAQLKVGVAA